MTATTRTLDRSAFDPVRFALAAFGIAVVVLWAVALLSHALLPPDPMVRQVLLAFPGDGVFGAWTQFDAGWYRSIAVDGYFFESYDRQASVAFFPAYPLAMRWLGWVLGGNPLIAGVLVTLAAGCGAVVAFARWCADRLDDVATRWAVAALLVYPFAFYLVGPVYADALFVAAALGAFLLLERGHPVLAGLVGAVATATRPVGMAVVIGLVVGVVALRGSWRRLRPVDAGVLLSLGGLLGWMGYLWHTFGDPLLFSRIQGAWGQEGGPATWFKLDLIGRIRAIPCHFRGFIGGDAPTCAGEYGSDLLYSLGVVLQAGLIVGALVTVPWVIRRFGWSYGLYTLAVLAPAIIGSQDFHGAGRYLLAAFPVFALLGAVATRLPRRLVVAALVGSALLAVTLTSLFARGYYVA